MMKDEALAAFLPGRGKNTLLRLAANALGIALVDEQPEDVAGNPQPMQAGIQGKQGRVPGYQPSLSWDGPDNDFPEAEPGQPGREGGLRAAFEALGDDARLRQPGYISGMGGTVGTGWGERVPVQNIADRQEADYMQLAQNDDIGELIRQSQQPQQPIQNNGGGTSIEDIIRQDSFSRQQMEQNGYDGVPDNGLASQVARLPQYGPVPRFRPGLPEQSKTKRKPGQGVSRTEQRAFLEKIMPDIYEVAERAGLDPRLIAAQVIGETGWGERALGNNYFGIKSHGRPGGQKFVTHEEINGRRVKQVDDFRQYASFRESLHDYIKFLQTNKRYRPLFEAKTLGDQLRALQKSGYASKEEYLKLVSDIAKYNVKLEEGAWRLPDGEMPVFK